MVEAGWLRPGGRGAAQDVLGKPVDKVRWGQRVRDPGAMDLITIDDVTGKIDTFMGCQVL